MNLTKRATPWIILLLAVGFLNPASVRADDSLSLSLRETVIRDLSSSGLTLSFQVAVVNDGSTLRRLVRTRYRVMVNRREFLNMDVALDDPLIVPARGEILISLPVKITYSLLFEAVGLIEDRAGCEMIGEIVFETSRRREEKAQFAFGQDFPIFKDPRIGFLPLKINSLSIGGADLVLRPVFRNAVGYPLVIDEIRFRLILEGAEILSGEIPGEKSIPGGGERAFDLPCLVDFFDLGPEIRAKFESGIVNIRFVGELEIATAWGRILVPFDTSDDVAVDKGL